MSQRSRIPIHLLTRLVPFVSVTVCGGCQDTPTPPVNPVVGHFIGPAWAPIEPEGYYLALSLTGGSAMSVTGTGWLAGLTYPAIPLSVGGTYDAPSLSLGLAKADGSPFATLTGLVNEDGVIGEWTRDGASLAVELARIDTNATATYQAVVAGAFSFEQLGAAGFTFRPTFNSTTLWLGWPDSGNPLFAGEWNGPPLPVGTHDLVSSANVLGAAVFPTGAFELRFSVISGSVTLDVSTEYAMVGHVSVQAREDGGTRLLTFSAAFSAGCAGLPCRP